MSVVIGRTLAHYEVLEKIGQGGMGEVYRARDRKLGREVALKVLPASFAEDPERLARFEHEAKLLASLNHPHVATLYDLEDEDGVRFLTMELVEGETLLERIARGPIGVSEAVALFVQIAEGLEAAHQKSVVHRDLKPANVKITPEGDGKILDFGLAKALPSREIDGEAHASESPTFTKATALGTILGTAPYMSPEQARGKSVDKRTDVWSFGCCLYEALTGKPAFAGETVSDTIARLLEREPVWEALPETMPVALRTLLKRCLRKDPKTRIHDIADVRIELEEVFSAPEESPKHAVTLNRKPMLAITLVAGMALGVALSSLVGPGATGDVRVVRSAIPLEPANGLTVYINPSVAISSDGHHIAFVGGQRPSQRLYIRSLSEPTARAVDGTLGAEMPFFSPDGNWLGFHLDRKLMKVSVSGGAPIRIIDYDVETSPRGASWGPDGWIVYNRSYNEGLSRVREEGGEPEILTTPDLSKREKTHRHPELLPGGEAVLFMLGTVDILSYEEASIAVLNLETREYWTILEGGMNPRFSSTGHVVYARDGELLAVAFDTEALEVRGSPIPVVPRVATSPGSGHAEFALSGNGSLIYQPGDSWGDDNRVVWVDRQGRTEPLIEARRAYSQAPRLSPDGRSLAVWIDGANNSVWVYDIARGTLGRLSSAFANNSPAWTPDSERIAFRSDRGGPMNLYLQAIAGTGQAERLADSGHSQTPGSWSPDGRLLAFHETHSDTGFDLWILDSAEGRVTEPYLETQFDEREPNFSPDGKWITYQSDATGRDEIYIGPFPASTRRWQVSTDGGTAPRWRADGRELFYRNGAKLMAVDVRSGTDLVLGKPIELFETPEGILSGYDVAPGGQRFAMIDARTDPFPPHLNLVLHWDEELKRLVPIQ